MQAKQVIGKKLVHADGNIIAIVGNYYFGKRSYNVHHAFNRSSTASFI